MRREAAEEGRAAPTTRQYAAWFLRAERHRAERMRLGGKAHWRMLVELWLAAAEGRDSCVKNLCLAGDVPVATGLRYLDQLKHAGFIEEQTDPLDGRRRLVRLTPQGHRAVQAQLTTERTLLATVAVTIDAA